MAKYKKGFTLAEVLIALGVIGVIAAMTLPSVIVSQQKQTAAKRLEKTYSVIMQANLSAVAEHGSADSWFTSDITDGTANGAMIFADTYLVPYLNVSQNCELATNGNCSESIKSLDPSFGIANYIDTNCSKFYLNDGTLIAINKYDSTNKRFIVLVDLNGTNGPNTFGKDAFYFSYWNTGKFIPAGWGDSREACLGTDNGFGCIKSGGRGLTCTAVIMMDGWQIKDDYPW